MGLERALSKVDELMDWGIELLKKMIAIPTVNPPGENYAEFVDRVSEELQEFAEVEIVEVPRSFVAERKPELADYPRYILVARVGGREPVLEINGHYDVVPPGDGWSRDPFIPVVEGGKLFGRGAVDMKGGIAAAAIALRAVAETMELSGCFELLLVPDEEIGGETGTGYALQSGIARPNWVVIAEPSSVDTIWIGHRGAVWLYVEVLGKQAHASTPWLGDNAFLKAARLALEIEKELGEALKKRKSSYPYDDEKASTPTMTIGGETKGGAKINIVPGKFEFSIDRRLIVEEDPNTVAKEMKEAIESIAKRLGYEVRIRIAHTMPPAITSPNNELVKSLSIAIEQTIGKKPRTVVCSGGLDAWYYTTRGIPTVTYGPGPLEQAHKPDEYVELEQIRTVAKAYVRLAHQLIAKK